MVDEAWDVDGEPSTARIEAFSDGIFGVALTLLVLDVHVPRADSSRALAVDLCAQWPTYGAYVISFLTILVMWINHHRLFRVIRKTDHGLLIINGVVLLFVTLVPFSTSLLAEHLLGKGALAAAVVYCGAFECVGLSFFVLWRYARRGERLFTKHSDRQLALTIDAQYRFGPWMYLIAGLSCFVSPWLGFGICSLLAVFFALPAAPFSSSAAAVASAPRKQP